MRKAAPEKAASLGGKPFRQMIARHVAARFSGAGLEVFEEIPVGSTIIGKDRRVDVLVVSSRTGAAVALEAKYQDSPGTTDEKIHYALADCAAMWIPAVVVYGGRGWSAGVRHTMQASRHAVAFDAGSDGTVLNSTELDSFIASAFGLWPTILKGRTPVAHSE